MIDQAMIKQLKHCVDVAEFEAKITKSDKLKLFNFLDRLGQAKVKVIMPKHPFNKKSKHIQGW